MLPKIYILLPVHNRKEITQTFVELLIKQTYSNFHLVLIDDGSDDGTVQMVRGILPDVTVLKGNGDWWWGGSLQQGYLWLKSQKWHDGDIALIINDDVEFDSGYLETGIRLLAKHPKSIQISSFFDKKTGKFDSGGVHIDWSKLRTGVANHPEQVNCLSTRGLFLRISDFIEIGGFHPILIPHYLSDYEFTARAHLKGFKLLAPPSLKIYGDTKPSGDIFNNDLGLRDFIKLYFSKKSYVQPIYWTSFILLSCPWKWKMLNLSRIWYSTFKSIIKHTLRKKKISVGNEQ